MTHCVEKLPHSCGSSDALQVFENENGKFTGYCFACDTYVPDPYSEGQKPARKGRLKKSDAEVQEEIDAIAAYPIMGLKSRSLKQETLDYFGVRVGLSEVDGITPIVSCYPVHKNGVLVGYKEKLLKEKIIWSVGDTKGDTDLFGWRKALESGATKLFITEGEDDACALFQAFKDKEKGGKWEEYNPAVVSLTKGAGGVKKDLTFNLQKIRKNFKTVIFVFDMDDAGRKAVEDGMSIIPTAHSVDIPEKDANDCVIKGKSLALANACLFKTSVPKNTRIVLASTYYEDARKPAEFGLSYPWPKMTELTRGQRVGETYYLGSGVKMGKSTCKDTLAAHFITEHKKKVFMAAPEEVGKDTLKGVVGKVVGSNFKDPKLDFNYEKFDEGYEVVRDSLYLLDMYQHLNWENLKSDIVVAANEGCEVVMVDPITNLTNGINSADANTVLQEISQELAAMAMDFGLIVWIFCHLRAPDSGDPHERGGKVQSYQFAGSRAMMRSCHMMVGLEGNKDPDLPEEVRNQRRLVILEDRQFGQSGTVPLYFNEKTGLLKEIEQ